MTLDKFRKGLRRSNEPKDVTLLFSGSVQKAFAKLYHVLSEHPDFDKDTLQRIKDLSDDVPSPLETTFAMVVRVVCDAKDCAFKTKDTRITDLLDEVTSGLAGLDDDRPVIRINRGLRHHRS